MGGLPMTNEKPRTFKWFPVMVLVSIFQAICSLTVLTKTNEFSYTLMLLLVGYMAVVIASGHATNRPMAPAPILSDH